MQQYTMSLNFLGSGSSALLDRHPVAARVLALIAVFLIGYAEARLLRSRGVASGTWALGIAAASIWIAYPATPIRIAAGLGALLVGLAAVIVYYRKGRSQPSG